MGERGLLAEGEIVIGNVWLRGKGEGVEVFDAGHLSSSFYFAHSGQLDFAYWMCVVGPSFRKFGQIVMIR